MRFGMVVQTSPGTRHGVGFEDRSTEWGNFGGGKSKAPNCNQWGVCSIVTPNRSLWEFPLFLNTQLIQVHSTHN